MGKIGFIAGLNPRTTRDQDLKNLSKVTKKASAPRSSGNSIEAKMQNLEILVSKHLGRFVNQIEVIKDDEQLREYFDKAIEFGEIAIDTETTGLKIMEDLILGGCFYFPGTKGIYVPIRHRSYISGNLLQNQVSLDCFQECLDKLSKSDTKIIMHNAKFDIRMINSNFGITLKCYWDTMIASKLLNNIEPASLKYQYNKKILGIDKTYDYEKLFGEVEFAKVPVKIAAVYAAADAIETYELYQFQKKEFEKCPKVFNVFRKIEMPLLEVICHMEDTGIQIDFEYAKELSRKYHKLLDDAEAKVQEEISVYNDKIQQYIMLNGNSKIKLPVNTSSPVQLAILLYDIIKVKEVDKKDPRGTGEAILEKLDLPLTKAIIKVRKLNKLLGTYIDKLPEVAGKDGRIRASFNQMGTDTGRLSSSDPNLQNIPAKGDGIEVRKMFVASKGKILISSDFSQQEPRWTADMCGDENMIKNYEEDKDLYATIAAMTMKMPYEKCLEFFPAGTKIYCLNPNEKEEDKRKYEFADDSTPADKIIVAGKKNFTYKQGKLLRKKFKAILLGILYGKGVKAIAEDLAITQKEAQEMFDNFFLAFPKVKKFMEDSQGMAKKYGYVETAYGRRRQIPDMQLPEYEFINVGNKPMNFDPLDFDEEFSTEIDERTKNNFIKRLKECWSYLDREKIKAEAKSMGIEIKENTKRIADSERQCVNSRIQGTAGDQAKLSMIGVYNNKELREMGFELLLPVHDELVGECPIEYADKCGEILSKIMREASSDTCSVPMKCDVKTFERWSE